MNHYHIDTNCIHAGYEPANGESRVLPIVQSTTFKYDSAQALGELFDLKSDGFFYTRLGNPTIDAVEKKIAVLEGGVGALITSSGLTDFGTQHLQGRRTCRMFQCDLRRHL